MQGCTGTGASCNFGGGGPGQGRENKMYDPPTPPPVEPPPVFVPQLPPPDFTFDMSGILGW